MMKVTKTLLLLAATALVAACGSGGSSSSPGVNLTLSVANLSVDEGGTTTLTAVTAAGTTISVSGGSIATIVKGDGQYVVTAGQVDRTVTETFTFTASKDGKSATKSLNVVIENVSAASIEDRVTTTLNDKGSVLGLEEDYALYKAIIEYVYLQDALGGTQSTAAVSPMTFSEKQNMIARFNPVAGNFYDLATQAYEELDTAFTKYSKGQISEIQLEDALKNTQFAIKEHSSYGEGQLAPLMGFLNDKLVFEGRTTLEFSSEAGRYSRFVGNPIFGSNESGVWEFNQEFGLLNKVVPAKNNTVGFCEA